MTSIPSTTSHPAITNWLQSYQQHTYTNLLDDPNYFVTSPQSLVTKSTTIRFSLGNGHQILTSLLPACLEVKHELILVTCFWAKSTSRDAISELLVQLSQRAISEDRRVRVRICFSSRSALQKLFQTGNLNGKLYPPSTWVKDLGLPDPQNLKGLDLEVKSIFVRPFSVMHPKFILVDRQKAFIPSCNVSWESWFEGCIELQGEICKQLFEFHQNFWVRSEARSDELWTQNLVPLKRTISPPLVPDLDLINYHNFETHQNVPTILLPSPHRRNPRFSPFSRSSAPTTPLNTFLLSAVDSAKSNIYIQTPNLTSRPLIHALASALKRGVSIKIITSSILMIIEQLGTAFTITEFEIWKLQRRYNKLLTQYSQAVSSDPERQAVKPGSLKIGYYQARVYGEEGKEPIKSHFKCTVIDDEIVVLGSGNMDRASWFTSQELGVAILDGEVARSVLECTGAALTDRVRYVLY